MVQKKRKKIERIDQKKEAEIAPGAPVRYCPYCGVKIRLDYAFCPKCGKRQIEEIETEKKEEKIRIKKTEARLTCPVCKNDIEKDWISCPYCGVRLKDDTRIY